MSTPQTRATRPACLAALEHESHIGRHNCGSWARRYAPTRQYTGGRESVSCGILRGLRGLGEEVVNEVAEGAEGGAESVEEMQL